MPLFERLLEKTGRKVEPKTGWGEGQSPALFKADRTRGSVCLPGVHALAALSARGSLASPLFLVHDSLVFGGPVERPVHQRRGLKVQLCRLCGANLCVRARSAGESSPATREARNQARPR